MYRFRLYRVIQSEIKTGSRYKNGGVWFMHLARRLEKAGIGVDYMVVLDAALGNGSLKVNSTI